MTKPKAQTESKVLAESKAQTVSKAHTVSHAPTTPDEGTSLRLCTIGHSTRTADDFVALLQAHGVAQLADVRAYASSRRLPHFGAEALAARLAQDRIAYRHFPALGGRRRPQADSPNGGWQHAAFRGYADYLRTPPFTAALDALLQYARVAPTAIMCAEALWWQCHRRLIADALVARGVEVLHIMTPDRAEPHELTPFAQVRDGQLVYPGLLDQA